MQARLYWFGAVAAAALAASSCGWAGQSASAETQTIALDLSGPRPTAQLTIGDGPPVTAIFDTAAAASVLRPAYAARLRLPHQGEAAAQGPGGTPIVGYRTQIEGTLGDATFGRALAVAVDIPLPLENVEAIISPDVFSGRLVRFDFRAGVAEVLAKTREHTPAGAGEPYGGGETHGRMNRIPMTAVTLPNNEVISAIVDTGSPRALTLPLETASHLTLLDELTPTDPVRRVGVTHNAFVAHVSGVVRVGPLELTDPEIIFVDGAENALIGTPLLRDTIVVLDPAAHRSWLLPAAPISAE